MSIPIGLSMLFSLFVVKMVIPKILVSAKLVFLIKKTKFINLAVTATRNYVPTIIGQVILLIPVTRSMVTPWV